MDMRKPEYIVTIAEEGSITRAAERLFLTRPALSHYLLAIEESLGTPLFTRTRGGLLPTSAGEAYIRGAKQILTTAQQTQKEIDDICGCTSGTLKIGITIGNGAVMFNKIFPKFHEKYAGFDVKLMECNSRELEQALQDGRIDFAIMGMAEEELGFEYVSFCKTEIGIVLPREHRLAAKAKPIGERPATMDIRELTEDAFILRHPDTVVGAITEQYFRTNSFKPNRLLECSLNTMAYNMAKAGLGPAFVVCDQGVMDDEMPFFSLKPREFWWISLAYRRGAQFTQAEKYFQALVKEYYETNAPFQYVI